MANLDTKAALPDDIAVALDHGAITERDAADEMAKRLRAAVAEVERLRADVRQFERAASEILDDAQWFDEHHDDGDEASDRAHRIIQRVLGLFVGRELPGPWAFDKLLDERNELRGDVERLTGERDKAMLLVSGGAAELEAAAKEKVHSLDALVCSVSEERDKALADRKVLVEALRLVVAFDRARQHPDETGRISVPRLNEILWKCADALRAVGEEP